MTGFREAFPDLNFWGAADLIAEGDYVVGRWEGGGTHTGPAFSDFLVGSLPAATGRKMRFTGTTVLRIENGKIVEEIGLDDGVTALQQLGLMRGGRLTERAVSRGATAQGRAGFTAHRGEGFLPVRGSGAGSRQEIRAKGKSSMAVQLVSKAHRFAIRSVPKNGRPVSNSRPGTACWRITASTT